MRVLLLLLSLSVFVSCSLQSHKAIFDKSTISKIELLVADSTLLNEWQNHQDSGLTVIDGAVYFVDSTGAALHTPMQKIVFDAAAKDSLLSILNAFLDHSNNEAPAKACILLFRHSLLFYNKNNELVSKADICFDCGALVVSGLQKNVDLYQDQATYKSLIALFKARNVYLYNAEN